MSMNVAVVSGTGGWASNIATPVPRPTGSWTLGAAVMADGKATGAGTEGMACWSPIVWPPAIKTAKVTPTPERNNRHAGTGLEPETNCLRSGPAGTRHSCFSDWPGDRFVAFFFFTMVAPFLIGYWLL